MKQPGTALLTLAALGAALLIPQTLPAQAPPANGPRAANGPPRMPQLKPDPQSPAEILQFADGRGDEIHPVRLVKGQAGRAGAAGRRAARLWGDSNFIVRDKLVDEAEQGGYVVVGPMGYNFTGWYGSPVILIGGGAVKPANLTQLSRARRAQRAGHRPARLHDRSQPHLPDGPFDGRRGDDLHGPEAFGRCGPRRRRSPRPHS